MIIAENIHKFYENNHILKGINLRVDKGEIISLGSITPLLWVNKPCSIRAKIDEFDECTVNFL